MSGCGVSYNAVKVKLSIELDDSAQPRRMSAKDWPHAQYKQERVIVERPRF